MRQIRFRVWHTSDEIMHIGTVAIERLAADQQETPLDLITGEFSNIIPMQFTGLHDKNGKEIYEGDVVRNKDAEVYPIKYEFNSFNGRYMVEEWELEVIGNIYENPELLGTPPSHT